jgi:dihydroorotate dehydrogenase electron transfer subunit
MPVDLDARVAANQRLSHEYNVVTLEAAEIAGRARPGQFVMVRPARGTDPLLRRPYSIFEILKEAGRPSAISLLNKRVGTGTRMIFDLEPGERLPCLGPLGRPFTPLDPPAEAWLVAGGVGIAPFATLAEELRRRGTRTVLFYGARSAADLFCREPFERAGVELVLATEDGSLGVHGRITAPLMQALHALPSPAPLKLYACGPGAMLRAVADLARAHGRPAEVSLEQVMGCGLGGCYSCVVQVKRDDGSPHFVRSCLSGPVFDADRVVWEMVHGVGH